jgi:methionyl-tRNA formyltransferase
MEEGLDTGPFAATASVPIAGRYASEVIEELASLGARKLIDTLASIADGSAEWTPQQDAAATYAPKITKADVAIDSSLGRLEALARIRVSGLRTPVRIRIDDRLDVTVMRARLAETDVPPGFAVAEGGLLVIGFADGGLALERVTLAGKPPTSGEAWLRGARLHDQVTWGPVS